MVKILLFVSLLISVTFGLSESGVLPDDIEDVTILNIGDTMLGRQVGKRIKEGMNPFLYVREKTAKYDLVVANLEGPITDTTKCQKKAYSFKFATTTAVMLADSNIGLVTLANNHSFDCYSKGVTDTRYYLSEAGIGYFGGKGLGDSYIVREVKGKDLVFVGIDMSIGEIPIALFYPLINRLDKENDLVVVHIHWGNEYELNYSKEQQIIGHTLVDKGADLIIGHHPHVIQPVEIYNNKPIFYSLGNFIFDQSGEETTKGIAVEFILSDEGSYGLSVLPYRIKDHQPAFLSEEETKVFCEDFLKDAQDTNKSEETCSLEITS